MKLLLAVQRYGREVFGGAETYARLFASQLVARGHTVDVITSCAVNYVDWANSYAPGKIEIDGVQVHRLPVLRPRSPELFGDLHARVMPGPESVSYALQREWMRLQGPLMPSLGEWISTRSGEFAATIFITYLYYTTWAGISAARSPVILHPTAHDEPPAHVPLFHGVMRMADGFGFLSHEEAEFVTGRFHVSRPSVVTGVGIDPHRPGGAAQFRRRFRLGDRPYLVCVGRTDKSKGTHELYDYFIRFKRHRPGPLALVYIGEEVDRLEPHKDVVKTGFVDDATKLGGLDGATALVQPSSYESFSIVLSEGWAAGLPALVQWRSDVTRGHVTRSGGGLAYRSFLEFEAALERLLADEDLRRRLGEAGRKYVEENFRWPALLEKYERFLERVTSPLAAARRG